MFWKLNLCADYDFKWKEEKCKTFNVQCVNLGKSWKCSIIVRERERKNVHTIIEIQFK